MHKKLAADLTSLAHSILQMKNREDVFALKKKAYEVYEKLAVLAYVEEYINNTPNPEHTKEELMGKMATVMEELEQSPTESPSEEGGDENAVVEMVVEEANDEVEEEVIAPESTEEEATETELEALDEENVAEVESEAEEEEIVTYQLEDFSEEAPQVKEKQEEETTAEEDVESTEPEVEEEIEEEAPKEEEEVLVFELEEPQEEKEEKKMPSLEEELQDTIAVDVVADLFENAPKKSLNDKLHGDIQIGLNDRIAFVKNLFDGSQEDFNRVVSQLNTFKTQKEAKKFIDKMVKPDYDWSEKEEFEERFMAIVERKFA